MRARGGEMARKRKKKKIGRNDPCPCGSGKKYKHCCLPKERKARQHPRPEPVPEVPNEPISPEIPGLRKPEAGLEKPSASVEPEEAGPPEMEGSHKLEAEPEELFTQEDQELSAEIYDALWEEFEEADYEGRIGIFRRALDEGLLDAEMAFEMLSTIYDEAVERGEWERFESLLLELRNKAPEVYDQDSGFYTLRRLEKAVNLRDSEAVAELIMEFGRAPLKDADMFFKAIDILMYHGYSKALVEAMTVAWPEIRDNYEGVLVPWAVDEFRDIAFILTIFNYVEEASEPRADDPSLVEHLSVFADVDQDKLERVISALVGKSGRTWTMEDFVNADNLASELFFFSLEFLGELRRERGVPYSKGELGRVQLTGYFLERLGKRKRKEKKQRRLLFPEARSFDRYIGKLLPFVFPQLYKAGCAVELVPAWGEFLVKQGLLTEEEIRAGMRKLRPLAEASVKVLHRYRADPSLVKNLQKAWGLEGF